MVQKFLCWILIASTSLIIIGCVHTKILEPNYLSIDNERNIKVYTKDGRIFKFEKRDYSIIEIGNTNKLRGTGIQILTSDSYSFRNFHGAIDFDEIDKIETTEPNVIETVGLSLLSLPFIIYIIFLAGGGFNFH